MNYGITLLNFVMQPSGVPNFFRGDKGQQKMDWWLWRIAGIVWDA
jgi:hypothetical protein